MTGTLTKQVSRVLSLTLLAASSAEAANKAVTVKGSDTMVILGQRWAEEYMKARQDVIIQITGGGSGTGIAALINGSADIVQSSRPMKPEEKEAVKRKRGEAVREIPVALDGVAIYVHQVNPLESITLGQAKNIYTAKITNWEDLGALPGTIISYGRENNSGTYMYFKEHVLNDEDFAPEVLSLPGTAAVINAVSKDKKAIGYGGIAYAKGIKALKVRRDDKSSAFEPTLANVVSSKYPISRSLYFYVAGEPQGHAKAFIDWVLGPSGQKICENVGYYPLPKENKAAKKK